MSSQKKLMYGLMCFVVTAWGLDYIFAKQALAVMPPMVLLFFKYSVGIVVVFIFKAKNSEWGLIRLRDIPVFLVCSLLGEIGYFSFEYTAMDYLPVSLITIILAFVPALSIIVERVVYKKKSSGLMVFGILLCIFGVALVIGMDYKILLQGRIIGYLLAFAAVFAWNAYNFITASLHSKYQSLSLTFNQLCCTLLLIGPYALTHLPSKELITPVVIGGILYLGIFSAGFGFMIQVRSLKILGPTQTAMFSNFLPVTATFFGWLILKETISVIQIIGGAIVITAGVIVIREKGKAERAPKQGTEEVSAEEQACEPEISHLPKIHAQQHGEMKTGQLSKDAEAEEEIQ